MRGTLEPKNFNLRLSGELGSTILTSELEQPNSAWGKAVTNFLRELDALGCKATGIQIESDGRNVSFPVAAIHAGV